MDELVEMDKLALSTPLHLGGKVARNRIVAGPMCVITFAAVLSSGTITPRHAPAHSFDELIRVAMPGASIVFSLRDDPAQEHCCD